MVTRTPPLGWNTWNTFGKAISEELVLQSARALVDTGPRDAGFTYVVLDDGWSLPRRDGNGRLAADPQKFPLWENITDQASCNHGFASYAALLIMEAEAVRSSEK